MPRLARAGLAVLLMTSLGPVTQSLAQGATPTVDDRRGIQMKADLLSLKTMLALRDDQVAKWDAYEKALQEGIEQSRSFGVAYCTIGGGIMDQARGPGALAKRMSDLEILFRQRAKELASLASEEKEFAVSLTPEQSNTYSVLSGRVLGMVMLPAYAQPWNGLPGVCPPSATGLPRPGR